MERLNRDYQVNKENYTELVSRREQAKISEDVESGTDQIKFRIIEPPYVPAKPAFPNRPLFDLGVLVSALGIGYGIGFLISLMQPVFYNTHDLQRYTSLVVLGGVTKYDTAPVLAKRKYNLLLFSMVNLDLVVSGAFFMFAHSKGYRILDVLNLQV